MKKKKEEEEEEGEDNGHVVYNLQRKQKCMHQGRR
jgi:hypothetical protein